MQAVAGWYHRVQDALCGRLGYLDGLPPLALRIYLFFPFLEAGRQKLQGMENTVEWFGNPDWGLGLPFPAVMAHLAAYTEFFGAWLLLIGLATRWISIPLIVTMLVAIFAYHIDYGWFAIAQSSDSEVAMRIGAARELLQEHGNYRWLTEKGEFVILQNGIEFAVTYLLMLSVLLVTGGGRFTSVDYYLSQLFPRRG